MYQSKVKFISGVMRSGKSAQLMDEIGWEYNNGCLILKPSQDTRDGDKVVSRKYKHTYPAVLVDESNIQIVDLIHHGLGQFGTVFIDEVQFFSKSFIHEIRMVCFNEEINLTCSGLLKDFKGDYFESSEYLMEIADDFIFHKGECYTCGDMTAIHNALIDDKDDLITDGDSVLIEDVENHSHYETLCPECLRRYYD